jgi:dienelactone hydrolase
MTMIGSMARCFAPLACAVLASGCVSTGPKVRSTEIHNKQPVDLAVEVVRTKAERAPTVVLLHGCAGVLRAQTDAWTQALNAWGYNVVVLDSFTPRGIRGSAVCQRPFSVVTPEQRGAEAHDVARWVTQQAWATPNVALVGFSHGGSAVLHAVASRDVERNVGRPVAKAAIAVYPGCGDSMNSDQPAIPMQVHIGEADTWTAAGPCRDLARNWRSEFHAYPGAVHGYDIPGASGLGAESGSGTRHPVRYDAEATRLTRERVRSFLDRQLR